MPICRECGTETESLHRYCPRCGAEAGTGATVLLASRPVAQGVGADWAEARPLGRSQERNVSRNMAAIQDDDVVGPGRYILSFFLAGLVGLAIQYGLRNKGWTATWINAAIFMIIVIVFAAG